LTNTPVIGSYDTAIAYAGPSDFISYLIVKKVQAKKKIQWIHFDVTKVLSNANFGNKYYSYFDKIACVSDSAKSVFDGYFTKFSGKTIVFENIVSASKLNDLADAGATFEDDFTGLRLLTLGRISSEKGQFMIPDIVEALLSKRISFRWYCIGDGSEFLALQEEINKRELQEYIVLLGAKLNPYRFLRDCDIYVQTSLHEGYGITMKEAKCFYKPCVVTNVVSAKDFFCNGENAIITAINPQSIAEGVLKLIEDDSLRLLFENRLQEESDDEEHASSTEKIFIN
jgi:glycosyltransferase involved in cell wall biosynthesis